MYKTVREAKRELKYARRQVTTNFSNPILTAYARGCAEDLAVSRAYWKQYTWYRRFWRWVRRVEL